MDGFIGKLIQMDELCLVFEIVIVGYVCLMMKGFFVLFLNNEVWDLMGDSYDVFFEWFCSEVDVLIDWIKVGDIVSGDVEYYCYKLVSIVVMFGVIDFQKVLCILENVVKCGDDDMYLDILIEVW